MTSTGSPSSRDQPLESLRQFPRLPSVIHQRRALATSPPSLASIPALHTSLDRIGQQFLAIAQAITSAATAAPIRAGTSSPRAACPIRHSRLAKTRPAQGGLARRRTSPPKPLTTSEVSTFKFTSLLTVYHSLSKLGFTGNLPDAPVAPDVKRAVRDGRRTLDHLAQVHLAGDASLRR